MTNTAELTSASLVYLGLDDWYEDIGRFRIGNTDLVKMRAVPGPTLDSISLLKHVKIRPGESVLDLGSGTGIQSVFAAQHAQHVVATDIDPRAIKNTQVNIKLHKLEDRVDIRMGDLFAPLKKDENFDVVLLNLWYPRPGDDDKAWRLHERFFAGVRDHLKPGGRIYYEFGYKDNIPRVESMATKNGLRITEKYFEPSNVIGKFFVVCVIEVMPPT
ncbi:methyltransferase [Kaarinaea lacus]